MTGDENSLVSPSTWRGTTLFEIYADIWCPFAHVGLRAAVHERSRLGRDDVELIVRAWPLELVNGTPLEVVATTQHVNELRDQVAPGLFTGFDPATFPSTSLPALALASAAYQRSNAVGEAVSFALRDALFERGQDVSQTAVLEAIAMPYELEWSDPRFMALVHDEWHRGQLRQV